MVPSAFEFHACESQAEAPYSGGDMKKGAPRMSQDQILPRLSIEANGQVVQHILYLHFLVRKGFRSLCIANLNPIFFATIRVLQTSLVNFFDGGCVSSIRVLLPTLDQERLDLMRINIQRFNIVVHDKWPCCFHLSWCSVGVLFLEDPILFHWQMVVRHGVKEFRLFSPPIAPSTSETRAKEQT